MNPRTYVPQLFIDIGKEGHFYTLRQTYLHAVPGPGPDGNACVNGVYQGTFEERSFHHFNLSQDPAEAIEKAREAAQELGVKFNAPTVQQLSGQLEAVHRATADELAAREARYAQMREEHRQQREAEKAEKLAGLLEGRFTFGQHTGKRFDEVKGSYLAWVVSKRYEFEDGSMMRALADAIADKFAHLLPVVPSLNAHAGQVDQRLTWDVTVTRLSSFERAKFGADWLTERVYIVTMVASTGECLVSMSPSFRLEEGEKVRIKGTVKAHDYYGHQAQTKLSRVVVVGEYGVAPAKKVRAKKAAPAAETWPGQADALF